MEARKSEADYHKPRSKKAHGKSTCSCENWISIGILRVLLVCCSSGWDKATKKASGGLGAVQENGRPILNVNSGRTLKVQQDHPRRGQLRHGVNLTLKRAPA
jgi:hypothetical protein